jgi:hypothetical protein
VTDTEKQSHYVLSAEPGRFEMVGSPVALWVTATFSSDWYLDALREATNPDGRGSVRRQIAFAVALAETYLFEWVRDEVLHRQYRELETLIPLEHWRQPVERKWKQIPMVLHSRRMIPAAFDAGTSRVWADFTRLVDYRNGLLHGGASWPQSDTPQRKPKLPQGELERLASDWPLDVVRRLILELHATVGTAPPDWLK